jgi:hypothetical protein
LDTHSRRGSGAGQTTQAGGNQSTISAGKLVSPDTDQPKKKIDFFQKIIIINKWGPVVVATDPQPFTPFKGAKVSPTYPGGSLSS